MSLSLSLSILSCKKDIEKIENGQNLDVSNEQKLLENRKYLENNFKLVLKTLAPAMKNPTFITFLNYELNKKFDGEFHFLFSEILEHPEFSNLIDFGKLKFHLDKFKNLEGNNLYPQLYVPNFNLLPASIVNTNGDAEFVLFVGDDTQTTAPSYYLNEDGDPIPTGITVTEQYAVDNQVYIVSINENVNEGGILDPILPQDPPPPGVVTINMRIKDIRIYESKESWLAGDSEVHIKTLLTYWNGRLNGLSSNFLHDIASLRSVSSTSDNKGFEIVKATRSDINSGLGYISNGRNYPLETGWRVADYFSDPIAYLYCIFEYDKWPAEIRSNITRVPRINAHEDKSLLFRSSNSPYGGGNVPQSSTNANANDPYVNYAIFGNGSGLPAELNQQLFYERYLVTTAGEQFKNGIFFNLERY